jgi:hypothetical protein
MWRRTVYPNSPAALKLGSRVLAAFGNWENVRKASRQNENGVWVISRAALEEAERKNAAAKS